MSSKTASISFEIVSLFREKFEFSTCYGVFLKTP